MKTVVVVPAYNEETRIESVVRGVHKYVDEVIVVDDGSKDATAIFARIAGARVVQHSENCGAGSATMTGIEAARLRKADTVITIDADGQHNHDDIPELLKPIAEGKADIVFANRFGQKNSIPTIRRVFNGIGNIVTFAATGKWIQDSQCGFKAFGPKALQQVDIRMNGFEFCTEIVREMAMNNWRYAEIPTKVTYSEYTLAKGQSFANGMRTALRILLRTFLR